MRKMLVIGIGAGNPEYVTIQAVKALNTVDVFFVMDKGGVKGELTRLRRDICDRYVEGADYRIVEVPDPERDRGAPAYQAAVEDWHQKRADLLEQLIDTELADDGCGAILVWGDPSLYDSATRVVDRIVAGGRLQLDYEVIPGITSVQALAARHRIALNGIGQPVHITTGRQLSGGVAEDLDNVVVMLDGGLACQGIDQDSFDIYWGAYLGTEDEILVSGHLSEVVGNIATLRSGARAGKGWMMDTYLLRRRRPQP